MGHLKRLVFNFRSVWEHEWAFMARALMPKCPHCSSPDILVLVAGKMPPVCLTKQCLMKSSITVILLVLSTAKQYLLGHVKVIFENINILVAYFRKIKTQIYSPGGFLFSWFLDQISSNYCFACATFLLKPARPSAPSGMNKEPLWASGVSQVWTGLWGWYLWYSAI